MKEIRISELKPFDEHPYKVQDNEEMDSLVESIKEHGIMTPLMVRRIDTGYEIISGHRRAHAARLAGLDTVPAIEVDLSRDEAAVALVDSNLHREHILPSEKAFAYKLKLDALSRQGKRTDLTLGQVVPKSEGERTAAMIGAPNGESYKTVQRYIRLTKLIPQLLDLVDTERIAFSVGVELSYLDEHLQRELIFYISLNDCTPSYAQANRMHKAANAGTLDEDMLYAIMDEPKPNQREKVSFSFDDLRAYFPNAHTADDIRAAILRLLENEKNYREKENRYDEAR